MEAPVINVGIMTHKAVSFVFNEEYVHTETGTFTIGEQRALWVNGKIVYNGKLYQELFFEPTSPQSSFDLKAVTIGVDFHWQRQEDQRFKGALNLVATDKGIVTINQVDVEEYLTSVISSEMSANASKELLKAHAVISRSWLLAQVEKNFSLNGSVTPYKSCYRDNETLIRWYDREDHAHFDVCADDHCQRYQGISKAYTPAVREALEATRGEVLTYEGTICDARFSKCCGGATERFDNTWEPVVHPYLDKITDAPEDLETGDLRDEQTARKWILSFPPAFCHTTDRQILSQVLNDYDQETQHFFRWQVSYPAEQLSELVYRKIGIDFGTIRDIQPIERGVSGRLIRVKITGDKRTLVIGKELIIRKAFSESHLYSSAFIVEKQDGIFTFHGAGWGHGVGLCQIGAAVMGARGYNYKAILQHYFKGCELIKMYE